jgi:methyl-accepting chemotaxis protein/ligand-binding sensor domain-containing protein
MRLHPWANQPGLIRLNRLAILLFLLFWSAQSAGQTDTFRFSHLKQENGLSVANVNSVAKDGLGFMWFGTEDGLNRYDGYRFKIFVNDPADTLSLNDSFIETLFTDRANRLWIGTRNGLCRYVPEADHFKRYPSAVNDPNHPNNRDIKALAEDSRGRLWIVGDMGVDCMDVEKETFRHYLPDPKNPSGLSSNTAYDVAPDAKGLLWIATEAGLNRMDPASGKCEVFTARPGRPNSLAASYVRCLLPDDQGNLWVGTYGAGLDFFDVKNRRFTHFRNVPGNPRSLSNNQVNDIAFHRDGNLWVATTEGLNFVKIDRKNIGNSSIVQILEDANDPASISGSHIQDILVDSSRVWFATRFGGVNVYDEYGSKFLKYSIVAGNGKGLSHANVSCFAEDLQGRTYVGTDGGGINIFDRKTGRFEYLKQRLGDPNSLSSDKVLALAYEAPSTLWVGMWGGGVNRVDLRTRRVTRYRSVPSDPRSLSSENVFSLFLDRGGRLWVGTWNGGLNRYDRTADRFIRYPIQVSDGTGTSGQTIVNMTEDDRGGIWLATEEQGVNRYDPEKRIFTYFRHDEKDPTTLSGNYTIGVMQDRKGRIWITSTTGLNCLLPKTGKCVSFHKADGLPSETLHGILEDDQGNLWISSIQGLSKVTVQETRGRITIQCSNFTPKDGLQAEQFGRWAYMEGRDGAMFFGGLSGFNLLHPRDIRRNPIPPKVVINDFQLSLKPVSFRDPGSPLHKPIELTDALTLSYRESMLTFGFVALGYTQPENNQYAYKLEKFDAQWHYVGADRRATYTNLNPGTYTFRVKASNNDGMWNEQGASLKLVITPPFWRRPIFLVFLGLAILGAANAAFRWRIRRLEAHRRTLEAEITRRTSEIESKTAEIAKSNERLSETGRAVALNSQGVSRATTRIGEAMKEVRAGTVTQTQSILQTRRLVDSLLAAISSVTFETRTSTRASEQTTAAVEKSTASMQQTLDAMQGVKKTVGDTWTAMERLLEHSKQINGIVLFVEDIGSRVNVLALNALIEAVKAGNQGSGFMVVAKEIRDLAKGATDSTSQIASIVDEIQADVKSIEQVIREGLESIQASSMFTDEGREILLKIRKSVETEKERLASIAGRMNEMQKLSSEVQAAVDRVAEVSDKNRDSAEKVDAQTNEVGLRLQELSNLASMLGDAGRGEGGTVES